VLPQSPRWNGRVFLLLYSLILRSEIKIVAMYSKATHEKKEYRSAIQIINNLQEKVWTED
jgi:hypothetical protein